MNKFFCVGKANTLLFLCSFNFAAAHADEFTGQYLATGNVSTQVRALPSLNNRLTATYVPAWTKGNFDFRLESYTENSFHTPNNDMVRERKFEGQVNYNFPITDHLNAVVGALRHENYTFRDNYYWTVAGVSWNDEVAPNMKLSATVLAEKRNGSGRVFYDFSGTAERRFQEKYGAFVSAHIYQNLGEFDATPSRKRELEIGVNYDISKQYYTGVSYFYHQQVGDPADRFSFLKLKLGINF